MMKATLLVPLYLNDGTKVSESYQKTIEEQLCTLYGGVTIYKEVAGVWVSESSHTMRDQLLAYVVVSNHGIESLQKLATDIAKDLGQECVYVEYHQIHFDLIKPNKGGSNVAISVDTAG